MIVTFPRLKATACNVMFFLFVFLLSESCINVGKFHQNLVQVKVTEQPRRQELCFLSEALPFSLPELKINA